MLKSGGYLLHREAGESLQDSRAQTELAASTIKNILDCNKEVPA